MEWSQWLDAGWGWVLWLVFFIFFAWVVYQAAKTSHDVRRPSETPEEKINRAYARGKISKEEYERQMKAVQARKT